MNVRFLVVFFLFLFSCQDTRRLNRFTTDGSWLRDRDGRVILLRGINLSDEHKRPDASGSFFPSWLSPATFQEISDWGLNSVRLLIVWEAVEPRRGEYDVDYLDQMERLIDWAAQAGLYVIVDMHQDLYARRFGGDGAPDWAILDDGLPFSSSAEWYLNYAQPAVQRAFDNFWKNTDGIQDRYRDAWSAVVQRVKHHPNVIGYDLMNEPFPGSLFLEPSKFDRQFFQPFTTALAEAIHEEDPEGIVFFEPNAMRTNVMGADGFPTAMDPPGGPGFIFAPHFYDPVVTAKTAYDGDAARLQRGVEALVAESIRFGAPLWVGEWSGVWTVDHGPARGREFLEGMLSLYDEYKVGWSIWNYSTLPEDYLSLRDGSSGAWARRVIERPYAVVAAGPIAHISFDSAGRRFDLEIEDDGGGETVVRVPSSWSPKIDAGARRFDWDVGTGRLTVRSKRGERVVLSISDGRSTRSVGTLRLSKPMSVMPAQAGMQDGFPLSRE